MAQNDQVQALIQEIDEVLSKTSPRLPWVMSNDAMRQRQVLEQARTCLSTLQVPADETTASPAGLLPSGQPAAESAQQVLQSVLQEMTYLRVNMLQPMRSDVELLRQQREALTQEIRQLEAQRQQYALPQQPNPQLLMEFLQSAMGQMQENLRGQVTQMVATLADQPEPPLLEGVLEPPIAPSALSPVQRLEQIQRVQTQSDQLLLKLDSTLQVIFESLENNIQSYQESLEQGLNRIHGLGQQGEAMFAALVNRLAEQLGREASAYLQSSIPQTGDRATSNWENRPSLAAKPAAVSNADLEIARLLEELNALDQSAKPPEAVPDTRWQPQPFTLDATPGSLESFDQELQQLDLSAVPLDLEIADDEEMTLFQDDQEFAFPESESRTQIQVDEEDLSSSPEPGNEDLESALDLLNQLSAEVADQPIQASQPVNQPDLNAVDPDDLDTTLVEAIAPSEEALVDSPDALYKDEFYQSLFGDESGEDDQMGVEPASGEQAQFEQPPQGREITASPTVSVEELFQANPVAQSLEQPLNLPAAPEPLDNLDHLPDEGLFEGLIDPASEFQPIQDAEADFLLDFSANSLPQSVETLLLSDPEPPLPELTAPDSTLPDLAVSDDSAIEADLFWDLQDDAPQPDAPESTPPSQPEASIETIAALTDLIPASLLPDAERDESLNLETDFLQEFGEGQLDADAFEPAQPGEDLLLPSTGQDLAIAEFEVGADTLQQLTADLSNLESDAGQAGKSRLPPAVEGDRLEDWALESWGEVPPVDLPPTDLDAAAESVVAAASADLTADQIASTITLEDLLFTEAGDSFTQDAYSEASKGLEDFALPDVSSDSLLEHDSNNRAASMPLAEPAESNAFTLEGLESLFEGVPDVIDASSAASAAEEVQTETSDLGDRSDLTLEDMFGTAATEQFATEIDQSPVEELSPPSQSELKKKIRSRSGSGRGFGKA